MDGISLDDVRCTRETPKALLVVLEDGREEWIPKSQVTEDSEVYGEGHHGTLVVTSWLAEQRGWA